MNNSRCGSMLLESTVAVVLVATALMSVAQLLAWSGRQRRQVERRATAIEHAANLLEHAVALPWQEFTEQRVAELASTFEAATLPGRETKVEMIARQGPPASRQIVVRVDWEQAEGRRAAPVELTAWRFAAPPPREAQP